MVLPHHPIPPVRIVQTHKLVGKSVAQSKFTKITFPHYLDYWIFDFWTQTFHIFQDSVVQCLTMRQLLIL